MISVFENGIRVLSYTQLLVCGIPNAALANSTRKELFGMTGNMRLPRSIALLASHTALPAPVVLLGVDAML
jgi:hypothetical protein